MSETEAPKVDPARAKLLEELAFIAITIGQEDRASKNQRARIRELTTRLRQLDGKS